VPIDGRLIADDLVDIEAVAGVVRGQLHSPSPPTAIFAVNDEFAIAVLHVLAQEGVRVPDDMALVGYDDIPVAAHLGPPLTTVAQPKEEQGRLATKMLIDLIDHPGTPTQRLILEPRLVVRQSCGAVRGGLHGQDAGLRRSRADTPTTV
jgi:DNA-binding LacI/PurR family transcriptional regulator